jgi:hypothetical protein
MERIADGLPLVAGFKILERILPWRIVCMAGLAMAAAGCGTLENGRGWGQDAIYPVSWERVGKAARRAVLDPGTWAPAVGSAVFAIDDWDERTADWASEKHPVFGSQRFAEDYSDYAQDGLLAEALALAAVTPSGDTFKEWTLAKTRGYAVEGAALWAVSASTTTLKDVTERTRPDEGSDNSFPSLHASTSMASATLANRNLQSIDMPPAARTAWQAGNYVLAGSVAWARVEGEKHFPVDVLAGAALGNMLTVFIHDAFMNLPEETEERLGFYLEPSLSGVKGAVSWKF